MGLYFRRSVRVGPFRLNLSTSGIGVSAGIPGFRVGTGPRGAYVHMGAGGVYYRQSLGLRPSGNSSEAHITPPASERLSPDATLGEQREIESGSVLEMRDSTSALLLDEIKAKGTVARRAPSVLGVTAIAALGLVFAERTSSLTALAPISVNAVVIGLSLTGVLIAWWIALQDDVRRTVVILYSLDGSAEAKYTALVDAVMALAKVGTLRHVASTTVVLDKKYHAGASNVVEESLVIPTLSDPPVVRSNLKVPILVVGRQKLCFFPDRLLVFDGSQVGAVAYSEVDVTVGVQRWIEEGTVPVDAVIVDRTWRYVNKKGGPDRRFNNNPELPIIRCESIHFRSPTGLNEMLYASRTGVGAPIADAIVQVGQQNLPTKPLPSGRLAT